jgi:glycopeptide antibiotics resistance protein
VKDIFKSTQLTLALIAIYLIALVWIIVLKFNIAFPYMQWQRSINLIPFSEPLILNGKVDFGELILNVLIFVPLGLYVGILFEKWNFAKKVALFSSISFLLEVTQYILGIGVFDITDIINNTLGGLIGLMIYKGVEKAFKDRLKAQKSVNILALAGTISIFSFLIFLKISRLWIFRM